MPREDRRIIFTLEEVYKAIYSMCVQKQLSRPIPGVISEIKIDEASEDKWIVSFDNFQENEKSDKEYNRDFMAAALMLYCRSLSIPMSKKARKTVELKGNLVILRLVI